MNNITSKLEAYYHQKLESHGLGAKGVGWKDEAAQQVRFEQLIKIFETTAPEATIGTVSDLGCGLGDLSEYLQKRGIGNLDYVGYDIMADMIALAQKRYQGHAACHFVYLSHAAEMAEADYTVASGIFNLRYDATNQDWQTYILDTLAVMNAKSRRGFAFNVLTSYSDPEFMKEELYYADPLFLFDYCKRQFSRNVALLHDYSQYDFTILVRKT